jgi:hypothetical protein
MWETPEASSSRDSNEMELNLRTSVLLLLLLETTNLTTRKRLRE